MNQKSMQAMGIKKDYRNLFILIFLIMPFADMATGIAIYSGMMEESGLASPSQVGRFVVVLIMIRITIKYRVRSKLMYILVPFIVTETMVALLLQEPKGYLLGVLYLYKLGFIVLLANLLHFYMKKVHAFSDYKIYLLFNLIIVAGSIYIGVITGLGNSTYGWGFGSKGFFASGNGLGIYLGVGMLILIGLQKYNNDKIVSIPLYLFIAGGLLFIGSKTALLMFVFCVGYYLLINGKKSVVVPMAFLACGLAGVFYFGTADVFYSEFGNMFDVILSRFESSENVKDYLTSARSNYVDDAAAIFFSQDSAVFRVPFGSGAYLSFQNPSRVSSLNTLEVDVFDTFYMYGLYGLAIYLTWIYFSIRCFLKYKEFLMGYLFLCLHSVAAGHVLFNGMNATLIAILLSIVLYFKTPGSRLFEGVQYSGR